MLSVYLKKKVKGHTIDYFFCETILPLQVIYITLLTLNHSYSAGLYTVGIEESILDGLVYSGFKYFPNVQLLDSSKNQKVVWNGTSIQILDTQSKYNLLSLTLDTMQILTMFFNLESNAGQLLLYSISFYGCLLPVC